MFIARWMERIGAYPIGKEPMLYPKGNVEELRRLQALVTKLENDPLIARKNRDLAAMSPAFYYPYRTPG